MKLSQESKDNIRKAYNGDLHWLTTIALELENYKDEDKRDVELLLKTLFKMNYIILETETEEYAMKYNEQVQDLYSEMKIDLTKMIDYEDMWEEL